MADKELKALFKELLTCDIACEGNKTTITLPFDLYDRICAATRAEPAVQNVQAGDEKDSDLRAALQMIANGHGCPSALAQDALDKSAAPSQPVAGKELRKLYAELTNTPEVVESGAVVGHIIFNEQLDRLEALTTANAGKDQ